MKGLPQIPSELDFLKAYALLQDNPTESNATEKQLALFCQWSRFDARLAEIWVKFVHQNWSQLSPVQLNAALCSQTWPAAGGVLLEALQCWLPPLQLSLFKLWKKCALQGILPIADPEQYFIGHRALGSRLMLEDVQLSLTPYSRWGFFGREVLRNKSEPPAKTLLSALQRRSVLDELVRSLPRISVPTYRKALGGWVGTRQAELDLRKHPLLVARGNTKGRYFTVRRRPRKAA